MENDVGPGILSYNQDMVVENNPFECGLGWQVDLTKDEFVGKDALARIKARYSDPFYQPSPTAHLLREYRCKARCSDPFYRPSPTAHLPRGYRRAGTQIDRLGESSSTVRSTCQQRVYTYAYAHCRGEQAT